MKKGIIVQMTTKIVGMYRKTKALFAQYMGSEYRGLKYVGLVRGTYFYVGYKLCSTLD